MESPGLSDHPRDAGMGKRSRTIPAAASHERRVWVGHGRRQEGILQRHVKPDLRPPGEALGDVNEVPVRGGQRGSLGDDEPQVQHTLVAVREEPTRLEQGNAPAFLGGERRRNRDRLRAFPDVAGEIGVRNGGGGPPTGRTGFPTRQSAPSALRASRVHGRR